MSDPYTSEQRIAAVNAVVRGLSNGIPLAVICREPEMPCDDTIRIWADADPEIARRIARARETGWDVIAMDCLAIVDAPPERVITTTGEDRSESRIDSASVQWAKNRAETRLKLLAKWDPKRYGELVKLAGADGSGPIQAAVAITFRKADGDA